MPQVLNLENKSIRDQIHLLPFFPSSPIEKFIEIARFGLDYEYPYHSIILFTIPISTGTEFTGKKILMCFIELFCTFQHYVILNYDYSGEEIYECYGQKIFKKEDIELDVFLDPKTIDIYSRELNIDPKDIEELDETQLKSVFELKKNQKKYAFNFKHHIDHLLNCLMLLSNMKSAGIDKHIPERIKNEISLFTKYFKHNINMLICLKKNLQLYYKINNDEDGNEEFKPDAFRRYFYNEKHVFSNYYNAMLKIDDELLHNYGHMKFYTLMNYLDETLKNKNNTTIILKD